MLGSVTASVRGDITSVCVREDHPIIVVITPGSYWQHWGWTDVGAFAGLGDCGQAVCRGFPDWQEEGRD